MQTGSGRGREASCTPRWSGEDSTTAAHFIATYFAPMLRGTDPLERDDIMVSVNSAIAGNLFTKSGIEMALWDLAGKAAGKPVYELLGGMNRNYLECYTTTFRGGGNTLFRAR